MKLIFFAKFNIDNVAQFVIYTKWSSFHSKIVDLISRGFVSI